MNQDQMSGKRNIVILPLYLIDMYYIISRMHTCICIVILYRLFLLFQITQFYIVIVG